MKMQKREIKDSGENATYKESVTKKGIKKYLLSGSEITDFEKRKKLCKQKKKKKGKQE